jgi:hypothetical protein
MSLMTIASKITPGVCVAALSFLLTLKLLDYQDSPTAASTDSTVAEDNAPRGSALSRAIRLFDERSSRVDNLAVTWNAAEGLDGSRTAILLDDRSKIYGSIAQEVPSRTMTRLIPYPSISKRTHGQLPKS